MSRLRTPIVVCLLAGATASDASVGLSQWFDRNVFKRIQVAGYRRLGFHAHEVGGDYEAFSTQAYHGLGARRFTDIGQMTLSGKEVFGVFNFNVSLADNRYQDPQAQKISLDYAKGPVKVSLGDIRGSLLNTNGYANLNKNLYGAAAEYNSGRLALKAVHSESKGSAKTLSIQGNNSAGPYYLLTSQVISDSEEVRVDGQKMRLNDDYVIDYQIGAITFVNRVISPTSTIVVAFETLGFNASKGTIQGAGASYDMGKYGKVGLTAIEQRSGGTGGLSTRLEQFEGYGPASTWYTLQFEPLRERPIIVRLNGFLQTEGVHYVFDQNIPSLFRFLFDVPPTSIVNVTYTPRPSSTVDGDRRVVGFDYRLPLGGNSRNYISYSQATGELMSSVTPMSGTARGIEGEYNLGDYRITGRVSDIPQTFVAVETRGFNRNAKSTELGVEFLGKGPVKYGVTHDNSSVSIRRTATNGDLFFSNSRSSSSRGYVSFTPRDTESWRLEHEKMANNFGGPESKLDSTRLSTSHRLGKVNTRLSLEHQQGVGPLGLGPTAEVGKISLDTIGLRADYATSNLQLGARGSVSSVSADDKSGRGSDIGLSATYVPNDKLNLETSYTISNSGQLATLGSFQNGYGLGYGGNAFSGGVNGVGFQTGQTDYRVFSARSTYRLNPRISIDGQFYNSKASGAVSSNSETNSYGLGLAWDLGKNHLFTGSLDQSRTNFIGSSNQSSSTAFNASLIGSPAGPWSYRLGTSFLLSGGNSAFKQDTFMLDGFLNYKLDERQALSFMFQSGRTNGFLSQRDQYAALMYSYQIFRNVALVGSYKIRDVRNMDPTVSSGAFRSRGFDLELAFNFGQW